MTETDHNGSPDLSALDSDQIELLYDHKRLTERGDDPVLVSADDAATLESIESIDDPVVVSRERADRLADAEDALRKIVGSARGLSEETTERMDATALLSEVNALGHDAAVESLTGRRQFPETSRPRAEDDESIDLESDEINEIRDRLDRADRFESRLPEHAENLRSEALEIAGTDDLDELREEVL